MQLEISKHIHLKPSCMLIFAVFVLLYITGSLYWIFTQNVLNYNNFLETYTCPVCYGTSGCKKLSSDKVTLVGYSRISNFGFASSKNIHFAEDNKDGNSLIFKKLAKHHTFNDLDSKICLEADSNIGCDVAVAVLQTDFIKIVKNEKVYAKYLQGTSPLFVCPSTRLFDKLMKNYKEKAASKLSVKDRIQIWTAATVNPESLILQVNSILLF